MVSENLKLCATSDEDLRVISAHLQDSITQIGNIAHLKKNKIFLIQFNRFMWEDVEMVFLGKIEEYNLFLNLKMCLVFIQKI